VVTKTHNDALRFPFGKFKSKMYMANYGNCIKQYDRPRCVEFGDG